MKNNYPSKRQNPNIQEKAKMKTLKKMPKIDTLDALDNEITPILNTL